jgi:hypothetical protein
MASSLSGAGDKILYIFLVSPMCDTCPVHFILLDLITLLTFDEEHESLEEKLQQI